MVKITLLGAGSLFSQPLVTDILNIEGLDEGVINLVDIDKRRLDISTNLAKKIAELTGRKGWKIKSSVDRRRVLPDSDYVINSIEVSGTKCVRWDNDIPLKYGIDQCIGDTIGPGGIMKALRTLPSILDILADCEKLCPDALFMNYTNPMSIIMQAALLSSPMQMVGLCHSVQATSKALASYLDIPYEQLLYRCGGINHVAWMTELKAEGKDLYPDLFAAMKKKKIYEKDPVRFDVMKHLGYFVTESSGHFSEYVPWYRKRKELIKKFCRGGYLGGSGFYRTQWPKWRKQQDEDKKKMLAGTKEIPLQRGHEYASYIIEAHRLNRPFTCNATVANTGLIDNLLQTCVAEVPVLVDRRGYLPTYFGPLPEQLAAVCRSHQSVYQLCAQGIIEQNREMIIHAMMFDPLSAAVCSPEEIRKMAAELFRAERNYIPNWCS
ncbi:Alpha-galactosidase [Limihaloglobus sulfuriphilus]|uniref:Alpha-galactosidase n=2 Tax=Limihaloglobus sulfuriphilus TaxID=1851148 RepID=A0A1Q2MG48_9BACT|nr:Alpha-galactosidase [Limihaloglobus sulfuriphilus]